MEPVVSVAMTAYNVERYLARAIESALAQQTSFPYEIVIGEDCSTDGTLRIALEYQTRYPEKIRVLRRQRNLGMIPNYADTFQHCRGKYIAWLDADDAWIDPNKLAEQFDVLESERNVWLCGHRVKWIDPEGNTLRETCPNLPAGTYGIEEALKGNFIPSPSLFYRREIHDDLPAWYRQQQTISEWPIVIIAALRGEIVLLDEVMATYTLNPGGGFWSKGRAHWDMSDARFYEGLEQLIPPEYRRAVRREKGSRYEGVAYEARAAGDFSAALDCALRAFRAPALADNLGSKTRTLITALLRIKPRRANAHL